MTKLRLRPRAVRLLGLVAVVAGAVMPVPATGAEADIRTAPVLDSPRFREVGRVAAHDSEIYDNENNRQNTGFLILSPASRRGYTVTEIGLLRTAIQSFDLDTLEPRQRAVVAGQPSTGGWSQGPGISNSSGEVIHAVDPVAKRIYLPLVGDFMTSPSGNGISQDAKRMVAYFLAIDEEAFDRDPQQGLGAFGFPTGRDYLSAYPLHGMAVSGHHVAPDRPGKLLAVFASPNHAAVLPIAAQPLRGVFDHRLAQWDPAGVAFGTGVPTSVIGVPTPPPRPVAEDWEQVLVQCATAPLTSMGTSTQTNNNTKSYQWGILAGRDAVHLGCQSAPQSGAVTRVPVDPRTGGLSPEPHTLASLGRLVSDVLVDEVHRRLVLRSFGAGQTWWVFDAERMRFVGSVAGALKDGHPNIGGLNPATGRLYTLAADECAPKTFDGRQEGYFAVRGGLRMAEVGGETVSAPENVVPELAQSSQFRIHVDPVRNRVFLRRSWAFGAEDTYPECDPAKRTAKPLETFWRVYEDGVPAVPPPGELDDSAFTSDVPEEAGRTEASFLGSGSGYGSRSLLIGGLDAPANGAPTTARSLC
ncbi:MAG: hypothetical protein M3394_07420, partial [Actinomycetota bacterium]|nr:hypothetical protein [Actinomycetota bacterium]